MSRPAPTRCPSPRPRAPRLAALALLGPLALAAAGLSPRVARADAVEARFFDARARQAYRAHRYRRALELFMLSHEAAPSVRTLYNAGVCAHLAGDDALAYAVLSEYARLGDDDATRRDDAQARLTELGAHLALVTVTSEPPGAEVFVDRLDLGSVGHTPLTLPVEPGAHTLIAHAPDHDAALVAIDAAVGRVTEAALAPQPRTGALVLSVGGEVTSAVARSGDAAPRALTPGVEVALPVGRWTLDVTGADGATATRTVDVEAGVVRAVSLTLEAPPPPPGRLLVSWGERDVEVRVDGRPVGRTPLALPLAAGEHVVEVAGADAPVVARRVALDPRATVWLDLSEAER